MNTLEMIVRQLAADEPYRLQVCRYCSTYEGVEDHIPTCVFRMAREWVEAHP